MSLFSLVNVSLGYNQQGLTEDAQTEQRVLQGISLSIDQGEKVALVGPSGVGKSTLLNCLYEQQRDKVALCPQSKGLVSSLSLYNNIYMARLEQQGVLTNLLNLLTPNKAAWQQVEVLAETLGLVDKMKSSVDKLSGGQQQRVAVGRAIYSNKPVFMGDEPVSSLDQLQGQMLLQHLCEIHQTVVIAIHDRELALTCFDRIIALRRGEIEFDKPAKQVSIDQINSLYLDG